MIHRQATLLVSDDLLFSLQGKMTIIGVYTGDINIVSDSAVAQQLVFTFILEIDADDIASTAEFEITLPGEEPHKMSFPLLRPAVPTDRKQLILRIPFPLNQAVLRPGKISARIILDQDEITVAAPWIVNVSGKLTAMN